jgi:hypothetical protein
MTKDDFNEWLWEEWLSNTPEPYKWYIKGFSYAQGELSTDFIAVSVNVNDDGSHTYDILNKYEICAMDEDNWEPTADEIYFVRHEALENEIYWEIEAKAEEEAEAEKLAELAEENKVKEFKETGSVGVSFIEGKCLFCEVADDGVEFKGGSWLHPKCEAEEINSMARLNGIINSKKRFMIIEEPPADNKIDPKLCMVVNGGAGGDPMDSLRARRLHIGLEVPLHWCCDNKPGK